jgi:hypothetical protein
MQQCVVWLPLTWPVILCVHLNALCTTGAASGHLLHDGVNDSLVSVSKTRSCGRLGCGGSALPGQGSNAVNMICNQV